MREIKFRAWRPEVKRFRYFDISTGFNVENYDKFPPVMQYTGLKDKNGVEIYFNDILRFSDKWEWYGRDYAIKMMAADEEKKKELQAKYDAEPYEERVVKSIEDYEWLLSSEIQVYWEIIGNIYENPELKPEADTD